MQTEVHEKLRPYMDDYDNITESQSDYCSRFREFYGQFPNDVIVQWFYDHPDSLSQNNWLNYNKLTFSLVRLPMDAVKEDCFRKNPFVEQYCHYFLDGKITPRIQRLARYIEENGSWPVPPVVLDNIESNLVFPWGVECSSPYQLLEGHHRFAALIALLDDAELLTEHEIWLCSRETECKMSKMSGHPIID
ncbi:MAG: hypothetical protein KME67_11675 [Candidatus Thiodiazotropha sp. (ex Codakia orbicularis)]|nr:hypothetical protein [Candidatus Thiodiazotropha sp. (ex Codakia orbicularis)]